MQVPFVHLRHGRMLDLAIWIGPIVIIGLSVLILLARRGSFNDPPRPEQWIEAVDVSDMISTASLRSAAILSGHDWNLETETLLLFAIGPKVCFGCLLEIEDFTHLIRIDALGDAIEDNITPLVLSLSDHLPEAQRFARVAELSAITIPTAKPDILTAFGFGPDRESRQIVALVDAQSGRVLRQSLLASFPTPLASKLEFLSVTSRRNNNNHKLTSK